MASNSLQPYDWVVLDVECVSGANSTEVNGENSPSDPGTQPEDPGGEIATLSMSNHTDPAVSAEDVEVEVAPCRETNNHVLLSFIDFPEHHGEAGLVFPIGYDRPTHFDADSLSAYLPFIYAHGIFFYMTRRMTADIHVGDLYMAIHSPKNGTFSLLSGITDIAIDTIVRTHHIPLGTLLAIMGRAGPRNDDEPGIVWVGTVIGTEAGLYGLAVPKQAARCRIVNGQLRLGFSQKATTEDVTAVLSSLLFFPNGQEDPNGQAFSLSIFHDRNASPASIDTFQDGDESAFITGNLAAHLQDATRLCDSAGTIIAASGEIPGQSPVALSPMHADTGKGLDGVPEPAPANASKALPPPFDFFTASSTPPQQVGFPFGWTGSMMVFNDDPERAKHETAAPHAPSHSFLTPYGDDVEEDCIPGFSPSEFPIHADGAELEAMSPPVLRYYELLREAHMALMQVKESHERLGRTVGKFRRAFSTKGETLWTEGLLDWFREIFHESKNLRQALFLSGRSLHELIAKLHNHPSIPLGGILSETVVQLVKSAERRAIEAMILSDAVESASWACVAQSPGRIDSEIEASMYKAFTDAHDRAVELWLNKAALRDLGMPMLRRLLRIGRERK